MNSPITKNIHGRQVCAQPVYKGGSLPAYWTAAINHRILPKTFASAPEVFRFVRDGRRD